MNRTRSAIALAVSLATVAAACSGGDDDTADTTAPIESTVPATTDAPAESTTPSTEPTTTTSTTTTTVAPTVIPTDVPRMPLTGVPIDDESAVPDRPALVVKLSNAGADALPQAGLNVADIVFEEVINDGATRLAAVFHTNEVEVVGPIRSGRAQDINLLLSLDRPLFAWSGGNPAVRRAVRESDLINLDAGFSSGYYRRSGRRSPNNLYSSTEALWAQTPDEAGRPDLVFSYLPVGEELAGDPATSVEVRLDNVTAEWTYDEATNRYFRRQNGSEHNTEMADGIEQVWVDNVVVAMADYGRNPLDGNPEAQILGSNPVFVFTGGTVQIGEWLRFAPEDPFQFFDNFDDLNPLVLQPGRTWMEIPRNQDDVLSYE